MAATEAGNGESLRILLRQVSLNQGSGKGLWRIEWHVENPGRHSVQLKGVRFPHGQFKSNEQCFDPAINLGHGEHADVESSVACDAEPGAIVENAFSIFNVVWRNQPWRIFVRLRVTINSDGTPTAITESITTQRVGFSAGAESES